MTTGFVDRATTVGFINDPLTGDPPILRVDSVGDIYLYDQETDAEKKVATVRLGELYDLDCDFMSLYLQDLHNSAVGPHA